ncbi:MAG: PorT family protein [Cyclobacteriaceae bacterium]|nr:PorT family protein [Cyclobacteriaceae bacterium HetDA_MAG_MS6]
MQNPHLWNKLNIRWYKIVLILLLSTEVFAQDAPTEHLIDYDAQWIHYGFLMGVHSSRYRIKYNEAFTAPDLDSVHSIIPRNTGGIKVGFVVNMRLFQYLDFRMMPAVSFYENNLEYRYTDGTTFNFFKDATMVELPLLLKYKSVRRGNAAMYLTWGVTPSIEAAGKSDELANEEKLETRNWNLAVDIGAGFDIYFPLFKFSPEIRYSYGLRNMLFEEKNEFNVGLDRLVFQNIGFFITFEGGPSYLKRRKRKK